MKSLLLEAVLKVNSNNQEITFKKHFIGAYFQCSFVIFQKTRDNKTIYMEADISQRELVMMGEEPLVDSILTASRILQQKVKDYENSKEKEEQMEESQDRKALHDRSRSVE